MANQGFYHPTYNPNGSKKASDGNFWYNTAVSFNSIADCFDSSKLLSASGNIGTSSGRPDGLFYDQIHESSILDLRMSSQKVEDYNRLIDREFNKLVAGTYRGSEGEWSVRTFVNVGGLSASALNVAISKTAYPFLSFNRPFEEGLGVYHIESGTFSRIAAVSDQGAYWQLSLTTPINTTTQGTLLCGYKTARTKSNTLTHTDIIGNPANYPISFKQSGVSGVPLVVAEDGTSILPTGALATFKLSRKANAAPLQVLKSTDSGVTWTALTVTTHYTFSTMPNVLTMVTAPATTDLIMVTYQTHTNMAVPAVNSEVLAIGDVYATNNFNLSFGNPLVGTMIGKVATYNNALPTAAVFTTKIDSFELVPLTKVFYGTRSIPTHGGISLTGDSTAATVKTFPYLTRANGKARLQLVFKEMKYSAANADWGDDSIFNIVDNVSTTTDWYGATVLVGQKYVELPYFIGSGE